MCPWLSSCSVPTCNRPHRFSWVAGLDITSKVIALSALKWPYTLEMEVVRPGWKVQVEEVIMEGEREMKGENTMDTEVEDRNWRKVNKGHGKMSGSTRREDATEFDKIMCFPTFFSRSFNPTFFQFTFSDLHASFPSLRTLPFPFPYALRCPRPLLPPSVLPFVPPLPPCSAAGPGPPG